MVLLSVLRMEAYNAVMEDRRAYTVRGTRILDLQSNSYINLGG